MSPHFNQNPRIGLHIRTKLFEEYECFIWKNSICVCFLKIVIVWNEFVDKDSRCIFFLTFFLDKIEN